MYIDEVHQAGLAKQRELEEQLAAATREEEREVAERAAAQA